MKVELDAHRTLLQRIRNHEISPEQGVRLLREQRETATEPVSDRVRMLERIRRGELSPEAALDALRAKPQTPPAPTTAPTAPHPPVAVIGMAGRFPGADNPDAFWERLKRGDDLVTEVPADRWRAEDYYDPNPAAAGKSTSKWGGFLDDIKGFDPLFFSLSPRDAELMDPQQRLFLMTAHQALEDAGYGPHNLSNQRCGVFVGCGIGDYTDHLLEHGVAPDAQVFTGMSLPILSARLSFLLNLKGPALAVDTACSSSLVAVRLACESMASGASDMAVAGGVSVYTTPRTHVLSGKAGMLSPHGRCYTFDARADGFVPAEAVAAVVLKPLDAALRDGDPILGEIIASGVNQDGRTNGITAPSATSQTQLETQIYRDFGINPEHLSLVEAHGTGTKLGDPIEISALTDAFAPFTRKTGFCAVGSAKAHMGHASSAAGVVGLIKVLLCLKHRQLPPMPHLDRINPHINFADSPFRPVRALETWTPPAGVPRLAAVSSFGFSGTNAHLVVRESSLPARAPRGEMGPLLFIFSDQDQAALDRRIAAFAAMWRAQSPDPLDTAFTLMTGRNAGPVRAAVVVDDPTALTAACGELSAERGWFFSRDAVGTPSAWSARAEACLAQWTTHGPLDSRREVLNTLASCFANGAQVDWARLFPRGAARRLSLPGRVFNLKPYWIPEGAPRQVVLKPAHPLVRRLVTDASLADGLVFELDVRPDDPLVADHRVRDHAVLPGTAYLDAVLTALAYLDAGATFHIQNLTWRRPLTVAARTTPRLHLDRADGAVRFQVRHGENLLCTGTAVRVEPGQGAAHDVTALINGAKTTQSGARVRAQFAERGVTYGPAFAALETLYKGEDWVVGKLNLPKAARPVHGVYQCHPAFADAALQAGACLFLDHDGLVLPFALARAEVYGALPSAGFACARRTGRLQMELLILDEDGVGVAHLHGLQLHAASRSGDQDAGVTVFLDAFSRLEQLAAARLLRVLDPPTGTRAELLHHFGVQPRYERLFHLLLDELVGAGYLVEDGAVLKRGAECPDPADELKALCADAPQMTPFAALIERCTAALTRILSGIEEPMRVLFPTGAPEDVAGIYSGNVLADWFNRTAAEETARFAADRPAPVRILEVGAGTGSTTAFVLRCLRERNLAFQFVFTDISPAFVRRAAEVFAEYGDAVSFKTLDLERDDHVQDLVGDFDVVLGANVVHATADIRATLTRLKQLLKPDGLLVLNEITRVTRFGSLTFGLTSGWWGFTDGERRLPGGPLLDPPRWRRVLAESGFTGGVTRGLEWFEGRELAHAVITAQADGVPAAVVQSAARPAPVAAAPLRPAPVAAGTADQDYVRRILAGVLKVSPGDLVAERALEDYGIDSLVTQQVVEAFKPDFGELPATLVFEYPTVAKLAAFLREVHGQALDGALGARGVLSPLFEEPVAPVVAPSPHRPVVRPDAVATDIAVIGLAGRYPMAPDLDTFWENLCAGRDCMSAVPAWRWDIDQYYHPDPDTPGHSYTRVAGFIDDVDCFDARFFKISAREAEGMDPQERLFLETAWHAVEDAGYDPLRLGSAQRVGVFVGVMNGNYGQLAAGQWSRGARIRGQVAYWSIANRVSFCLDYRGPSMAVDTACSSSLTAIHLACQSLIRGECEAAVAGGVNLILFPAHLVVLSDMRMLSPSGRCHAFGDRADGFADGEGVGAVLLKPLARALDDGDPIHGVVKGGWVNSGGRTTGYTVPSPTAQAEVIAAALADARVAAETVTYVEAHGTGTALGDPIEIAGLRRAFGDRAALNVGAVKTAIGHLEAAAGIAGLTKILLQMRHGRLTPGMGGEPLNPKLNLEGSGIRIPRAVADWPELDVEQDGQTVRLPRRAGISSFGAGGANAHLIIEAPPARTPSPVFGGPVLLVLSAASPSSLKAMALGLADVVERASVSLADVAYTLQVGRAPLPHRLAVVAASAAEAAASWRAFAAGDHADCVVGVAGKSSRLSGKAGQAFLQVAVEEREWRALAELWVEGAVLDWELLWPDGRPRRVSLPGYAFDKTRHWMKTSTKAVPEPVTRDGGLLGAVDPLASLGLGTVFSIDLTPDHPLVSGHRVQGDGVLPGVAFLSLVRDAWRRLHGVDHCAMSEVVWLQPLKITGPTRVLLHLSKAGERLEFKFKSGEVVFARGLVHAVTATPAGLDLEPVRNRLQAAEPAEIYARLRSHAIDHGPDFQVLARLFSGEHESLSDLTLGADPVMVMDGALQTICGIASVSDDAVLPFAVGDVQFMGAVDEARTVVARRTEPGQFDLALCTADGRVIAVFNGVQARPMTVADDGFFYRPAWRRLHPAMTAAAVDLYCGWGQAAVALDGAYLDLKTSRETWDGALASCQHLLILGAGLPEDPSEAVVGLFHLLQRLHGLGRSTSPLHLTLVTHGAQAVVPDEPVQPASAALIGLVRSAARECSAWRLTHADLADLLDLPSAASLSASVSDGLLALRHGVWFREGLEPVSLPRAAAPYRRDGHYLIAGGAGGIGLALAEDLAQRHGAKVSLLGRSPLDQSRREVLAALPAGRVAYHQADLCNADSLNAALTAAESQFGPLHGVFHAALVLADAHIAQQDEAGFRRALDPKVRGSLNLDACLGDRPLDFMVFFSSAQSFMGNTSQGNYSAGCTYMDALAARLGRSRAYSVKTINWGFWGETGSVSAPVFHRRMATMGVKPIRTAEGLAATADILAAPLARVVPFRAETQFLKTMGVDINRLNRVRRISDPAVLAEVLGALPPTEVSSAQVETLRRGFAALNAATGFRFRAVVRDLRKDGVGIAPAFQRLIEAAEVQYADLPEDAVAVPDLDQITRDFPSLRGYTRLAEVCADAWPDLLRGKGSPAEVLFPDGSPQLVADIYRHHALAEGLNQYIAHIARALAAKRGRPLRILEIGAGTGGTTDTVLPALADLAPETYVFSDLSPAFLKAAKARYGQRYPFVDYQTLDISAAETALADYDLILAANVLHATPNLDHTLTRVRNLLKPNGVLVINEVTEITPYATFTFGLLEGWWLYEDDRRLPGGPLLCREGWAALLAELGFKSFNCLGFEGLGQHVMVAENGCLTDASPAKPKVSKVSVKPVRPVAPVSVAPADPRAEVIRRIVAAMADTLQAPAQELDLDTPHSEFGLDSILGTEVIAALNNAWDWELSPTDVFNYATISELADYVLERHGAGIQVPSLPQEPRPSTQAASLTEPTPAGGMLAVLEALQSGRLSLEQTEAMLEEDFGIHG